MSTHTGLSAETAVMELLDDWAAAVRAKDIDSITAHYAAEIVAFDAIAQLQFKGREAYREHWASCLAQCPGEMIFELHEEVIHAGDQVAFCHALIRCGGDAKDAGWLRMSGGLRRIEGEWKLVHEHHSAPFDPRSGRALVDLVP